MRLTALFGFGWIGLVVDGHFTGLPRPCQRRLTPPRGSHRTPRYLQQDFLLFAEHFASIAGFEAFLPFAAAFFFAFTSLTSFRWSDSRGITRWFNLPLRLCSSGLGELAFQGRVTR